MQYALSTRQRTKVVRGTSPRLWNLMWPILGRGEGSFFFDNYANMLDQFLVNKNMGLQTSPIQAVPDSITIIQFPGMVSGDLMATQLRRHPSCRGAKFLFHSGVKERDLAALAARAGADGYVPKGDLEVLVSRVQSLAPPAVPLEGPS